MDKKKKLRRAPMYIALAAALPIAIGACSSSGSSSSDPASSAPAGSGSTSTAQSGEVQFAQCMRQNGVTNMPDPTNGHFLMSGSVESNPHFKSAYKACGHLLGASGTGGGNTARQQAELNFAHCMQTNGFPTWPDPSPNGAINAPQGVDKNSATFKNAYNKCKTDLPGNGAGLTG